MSRFRAVAAGCVIAAVAVAWLVAVALRSAPRERGVPGGPAGTFVALGDSVSAGSRCDCTAFPELVRSAASAARGGDAYLFDDSAGGITSRDVAAALAEDDTAVAGALRRATTVILTVGANDFGDDPTATCPRADACASPTVGVMRGNVAAAIARIAELSGGRAHVLVLGYWGVFRDGAVGVGRGPGYVASARAVTVAVNDALRDAARDGHATFVDIDAAFTKRAGDDRTPLLASDGDHPNAAGHRLIADTVIAACGCA